MQDKPRPTVVKQFSRKSDYGYRASVWLSSGAHIHSHHQNRTQAEANVQVKVQHYMDVYYPQESN